MERLTNRPDDIAEGFVAIGQIARAVGVRGEVKVNVHTDFPERFLELELVYLGPEARPVKVLSSRQHNDRVVVRLAGCEDRAAAEELRGLYLQIPENDVMPLAEGEHYAYDLLGIRVRTTDGRDLGQIEEVLFTGANEVLLVRDGAQEFLIPYLNDIVVSEDMGTGEMVIKPMPGLLE